ncbi:MBG domain-containing protein [Cyclobacterium sp.]|uniref:MBG domain-containing protein n=1 Tax=Cyclobacterium sp. TaxID=1966343 RepID=UPI0019979D4A|nr:MBG domain-containing protein [Cyclobacterium sp.]MBD3627771.1 gliding motility-associated C-terminal domain-containing protein [Cyclobacterium sp.]
MKLLLKNLLLLILLFFSCQQIRAQSTTVTFNEITSYIVTFGETYDNGGLRFSVTKESNATPNSGIKATATDGYQGSVALNDSNLQPGGIQQWSIKKADGSLFQFISIFLQEGAVGASTTGTISAFKNGSIIGSPKPIAFNSATNGLKTFDNDPDFYEVDEIRINADDIYNFLDHVTTGPPFSPLDEDPPLVTGITLNGVPPTTSESVTFTVNFSKTALNVSLDDFSLFTSGTTGSLAAISGSGNSYQVTVNAISGEGFLRLDLKSGTDIANEDDTSGVPAFSSGNTHTVSACFVENMESLPDASSNFSSNGLSFSLSTGLESESRLGFGAGNSNDFIKNNNTAGTFSISSSSLFTMNSVDLFLSDLSNGDNPTASGTLTITGKNNGNTVFTILKTSGFPVNTTQNGGFFTLDFSTDGDQNYRNTNVDEVEFTIADGFVELLIDNFNFCQEVPDTDTAAPAVQRILLDGNPGSTATSITYIVQFDENALNVSLDDFSLVRMGTVAGTLNQINGSGSTYQVEVTGISGEGSLQLQLNGGTDIADALNNSGPLEYLNGQIHLVGACFSESFEDESDGALTFSGNGLNFSLTGNWAVKNRIGFGANASSKYLENSGTGPYGILSTETPVTVNRIGLYLSSFPSGVSPTNDGTLTVTGKLNGNTLYTFQKTTGFPDDFGSTGGYFILDFATAGASDFSDVLIDELILEPGAAFTYLALDNFDFCTDNTAPAGYTVQIDQDAIGETNQDQVSFTFSGAELGSTYNYSFTSSGGGTAVTGSGTISGAEEMVNGIDLTGLSNGTVTLSVTLTDISGNEGAEATAQSTKFINTIPEVSPDVLISPPYQENASSLLIAETIAVSDVDGDQLVRAVIQIRGAGVIAGDNLSLGDPSPLSLQEVDANTFELIGTADASTYTSILRTLSFSSDSEDPTLGGTENERIISIIVEDENGGFSVPANGINNLQLPIEAVNDAPELVLPSNEEVISNQSLTFNAANGNALSASDADVGNNSLMVDLTVTNGTLNLADISGLTFILGSGTDNSNMQFSGNLASINNALEGMVFTGTTDFVGEAILSIEIDDQGNTGSGGSLTASNTLTIQVIAPNAPPLASNVSFTGSLIQGGNLLGLYSYSDAENDTESGSIIQWWLADDATGTNEEVIAGENGTNLTIIPAFLGRFISFEITPGDGINTGNPVKSDYQGPVYTLPLVSTATPAGIEANVASLGGEVSSDQFSPVTERGLVYNTSGNPDLSDTKIPLGSGTGIFSSLVSSLNPNATYYVRAYASNTAGTSFGQEESFTTEKQELTIGGSFTAENKVYDGTSNALFLGNELVLTSPQSGDDVVLSNLVIEFSDPQRGNDKVVTIVSADLSGTAAENYSLSLTGAPRALATISPKALSISASEGISKTYGQSDPAFNFTSSGFVAGDDETLLTGSLSRQPGEEVGSYAITEGNLSAGGNYTIAFTTADFAISPQTLSITANAGQTKIYGQADPVFSFASSGFVAGDDETLLTGSLSRQPGEDVGNYAITEGDLSAGGNYTIAFTAADFAISPQTLSITANAGQTKVYGQADPVFSFASSGFVAGDEETLLTGSLSRQPGEDVGSYAITEGDLSAGDNYQVLFSGEPFQILPRVKPNTLILDETGNAMVDPANLLDQTLTAGQIVYLDKVNFNCTDLGEQEIEVSVVDVNGNEFTSNAILTVKDQTPPLPMQPTLPVLHSECQLETWETPTAVDNCEGIIIGTPDRNLPIRENTLVTWTFVDLSGNLTTQTQEVIIKDTTSPNIEGVPEDETVYLNGSYQLPDFTQVATAQDNCSLVRFIQSPAAGTRFDQAEKIQVQLLATDAEGNESSTGFEINLIDLNLLAIDNPDLISIPWNSPLESLALPEEIAAHLSNGQEVTIPVEWIIPVLDTREAGLFQYKGSLELGNIQNPNQLEPTLSILVEAKAFPLGINISAEDFPANIEPGTTVGTLSTQDPQDNVHVYGLSGSAADNRYFGISGSELYWNSQDALPGKTTFTVEVSSTDRAGNTIYETFTLNRLRVALREINVPNTFTPNGDGINDSWGIKGLRYFQGGKVAVYERSGKRVFYTENPDELWDGTFFGNALPTGTYFWVISTGESGEVRRGVLTIFRD